jgi:osmoprotectant transport system permease protein
MRRSAGLITAAALLAASLLLLPQAGALFAAMFPSLQRPVFQGSLTVLALNHAALVLAAGAASGLIGVGIAVVVTRRAGAAFRPVAETLVAMAQTVPPVAVLAIAVPVIGFGAEPALIALALYGLLPIVQASLAGIDGVPAPVVEAASGLGFGPLRRLVSVELPLALPLILTGLRTSIAINVGTAAIASAVGVRTLGTPIILGLNGNNTAYVLQGALPVALLAITLDAVFERLAAATKVR